MKTNAKLAAVALAAMALTGTAADRGLPKGCAADVMAPEYWKIWNDDVQRQIDADIERNRKADAEFVIPGVPAGTEVEVEQIGHEFRFGAHIFNFNQLGKTEWNDAYKASYGPGGIFNQATVAFYWNAYEPVPGRQRADGGYEDTERYWNSLSAEEAQGEPFWRRPAAGPVIDYLKARDVRIHGHILIWGNAKPDWIYDWYCPEEEKRAIDRLGVPRHSAHGRGYNKLWQQGWGQAYKVTDEEKLGSLAPRFAEQSRRIFRKRVFDVAGRFGDVADSWDVVNESSCDWVRYRKSRTNLPYWFSVYGVMPGDYPLHALLDAKEAFPARANLAINDYNICDDFLAQVRDLQDEGAKIDIVGCQMHIFNTNDCARLAKGETNINWIGTPETIRKRLDMMARTGKRLHVSEITITSPGADERSRMIQAILTRNIYRAWFSHPALMGITWWNTVDGGGVKGEPLVSGLFTRDLQKKPAYLALDELINGEWKTRTKAKVEGRGDGDGVVRFRGFRGTYRLKWTDAKGKKHEKQVDLTGAKTSDLAAPVPETALFERPIRHEKLPATAKPFTKATVYGPFTQATATAKTAAEAAALKPGKVAAPDENGRFQFGEILGAKPEPGKSPDTVSFTALKVNSPAIRRVRFFWRQDWYGAIFLNGEKAGEDVDGVDPAWTERTIELQAGENEILFRSRPGVGGYWFAGFAIDDPKGELVL